MKYMTAQEIRMTWLNFFKEKGHEIEPGANLIPENDPTLLWINSGVAALKKYFDGTEMPQCKRITNVQKSIRTNDIENVGKTARHHTFFEMLGNFSIGDYFRKEAIEWAFEILTSEKYFGLDKNKLYITYNPNDLDTKKLWIKNGIKEENLISLESNFWEIGEGPCGPNTEVFYDRGIKYDPKNIGISLIKDDIENDRYIELWGIVFSQYNAVNGQKREEYKELPSKNIDTGAGLERICCILQKTDSNFETDLFLPIIKEIENLSNKKYSENKMAFRVIADHIRTCVFALGDGAYFSNNLRGYVLRRLLRRALRYGKKLEINEPFLYKLVSIVVEIMKDFYPNLINKKEFISKLILEEENKFIKTLNSGENLLLNIIMKNKKVTDEEAFLLYDTFGFPFELTKEICLENNIKLKDDGFNKLMEQQKQKARNSRKNIESMNIQSSDLLNFKKESSFLYDFYKCKAKVIGLFINGKEVKEISDNGYVVFDKTVFYAEMGGQISDTGLIENNNTNANVTDVIISPNKQNMHFVQINYGNIKLNDEFELIIDYKKRKEIEANHSATHLLHSALKQVLGNDVSQKGSYVCDKYLRFDFNYLKKVEENQLKEIEKIVNENIQKEIERKTLVLSYDDALKTGAEHEFNEKYTDLIRVVCFNDFSKEFCGGTHVQNTKDIGSFIITSEESIAAGIRRIEAITLYEVYNYAKNKEKFLNDLNIILETKSVNDSINKISNLKNELKNLKKENEHLQNNLFDILANDLIKKSIKLNNVNLIYSQTQFERGQLILLKDIVLSKQKDSLLILIGKNLENKMPILVSSNNKDMLNNLKSIFSEILKTCNGNGGGSNNMYNGVIHKSITLDDLLLQLKELIK